MDVMCLMHDQEEEYGLLRWPLKEVAEAVKCKPSDLQTLVRKGVLKGSDTTVPEFVYIPRSGRKEGPPVTLIPEQNGPLWYCSRMVKDEYIRTIRGESSRFGADNGATPKAAPDTTPKAAPKPRLGDGSSSSSSSSSSSLPRDISVARSDSVGSAPPKNGYELPPEARIAIALRDLEISVTSIHPTVLGWVESGFTVEQVIDCAQLARKRKPKPAKIPANYLDAILRDDSQRPAATSNRSIRTAQEIEDEAIDRCLDQGLTDQQIADELQVVSIDRIRAKRQKVAC